MPLASVGNAAAVSSLIVTPVAGIRPGDFPNLRREGFIYPSLLEQLRPARTNALPLKLGRQGCAKHPSPLITNVLYLIVCVPLIAKRLQSLSDTSLSLAIGGE